MLKTKEPLTNQLYGISNQLYKLGTDIQECINQIDEGKFEGARSDLVLILEELRGIEDYD